MAQPYTFSISEVLSDGRLLVFTYANTKGLAVAKMQVYPSHRMDVAPITVMHTEIPTRAK